MSCFIMSSTIANEVSARTMSVSCVESRKRGQNAARAGCPSHVYTILCNDRFWRHSETQAMASAMATADTSSSGNCVRHHGAVTAGSSAAAAASAALAASVGGISARQRKTGV